MSDGNNAIKAVCTLELGRNVIHGHVVKPGNVVVMVSEVFEATLKPPDSDECVCVGGFYEWPSSKLFSLTN